MKKIAFYLFSFWALIGSAIAQTVDPYKNTMTFVWASDQQPLFPIFYTAIYVGVVLVAAFWIFVVYRSIKGKTYRDRPHF